ncbi:lipoprotein [Seminibacterium arietis]|uniref:Lipoprotein n=1 Tax=Seminibacterium arietis TaxID=1173502 RepID=A0ABW3IAZ5_9PAST
MKKILFNLLLSAVIFLLISCGVKNSLYFPETQLSQQQK